MKAEYTFTMNVRVQDSETLRLAAMKHAQEVDGMSYTEAVDTLVDDEACLVMLLDPGHLSGCKIGASYAERF